jgi:subtilisin family serine protease
LDTGIDTTHPEFSGRILKCHSEITNTNTCDDGFGHGTHVAGIVGASDIPVGSDPNAKGVAPSVSFYIDQVLDSSGSGTVDGVIAGIDWATTNNAKVISMSLGTSPLARSQPNCDGSITSLTTAINNAVAAGVTVVAAAGNSGSQGVGAPGCISSTIAVGAVDSIDTIASFSSIGGPLTDHGIVAPGVNIYSTVPTGSCQLCDPSGYLYLSGTSMATPHVAGTIALMLKANPGLSPATVRSTLFNTACTSTTSPSCPTGAIPNSVYGHGRVDALGAYNAVATPPPPPPPDFSLSASPNSLTIQQGLSSSSTVTVTSLNGFSGAVTLSLSGNPAGVTGTFSPNPTSTTSTLTITVGSSTPTGSYPLTVTGVSGSLTHTTTITLTVSAPPPPSGCQGECNN